jgi:autotransporter-associated beta strand protein
LWQVLALTQKGGRIILEGNTIEVSEGSELIATGPKGGGEILVGGDWQGGANEERRVLKTPDAMHEATKVTVKTNTKIDASATDNGDGGTVVVWSDVKNPDSVTTTQGEILAKGGESGGDGGQIETSGAKLITDGVTGSAAANANAGGKAGEWLFDPTNVTIGTSGEASANNDGTSIAASSIAGLLEGGTSVTVTTFSSGSELGELTVDSSIVKSSGNADVTLSLRAANSIVINQSIANTGGSGVLNLVFDADNNSAAASSTPVRDGAGIVILEASLSTGGGDVTFGGTAANGYTGGNLYVGGGSSAVSVTTTGGNVTINGQLLVANSSTEGFTVSTSGGNIHLGGAVDSGNAFTGVAGDRNWQQALNDAANQSGDTWLAIIDSSIENSLATRAAGYLRTWLGGRRIIGTNLWQWVSDPTYDADTNPMTFFYQGTSEQEELGGLASGSGGTTADGYFANWFDGEPNNRLGRCNCPFGDDNESALELTETQGKWRDISQTLTLRRYVFETNLPASNLTLNAGAGAVTIDGAVGASKAIGDLVINSTGTTTLSGAITAASVTTDSGGTIQVDGGQVSTTGAQSYGQAMTLWSSTTFTANNFSAAAINMSGYDLTVNDGGIGIISGVLSGSGSALVKEGAGTLTLSGANSYSGETTISEGTLAVSNSSALGAQVSGTTVASGATLDLRDVSLGAEAITLDGGTLAATTGDSSLAGDVFVSDDATFMVGSNATLDVAGTVGLNGLTQQYFSQGYFADDMDWFANRSPTSVEVVTSISGLSDSSQDKNDYYSYRWLGYFRPQSTATYTFRTSSDDSSMVYVGTAGQTVADMVSSHEATNGLVAGSVVDNKGIHGVATRQGLFAAAAGDVYPVIVYFGENAGGARMTLQYGVATLSDNLATEFSTALSPQITKSGSGALTLSGANTFSGATTVSSGTLKLSSTNASNQYSISSGAVLELSVDSGTRDLPTVTFSGAGTLRKTGAGAISTEAGVATFDLADGGLIDVQGGLFGTGGFSNDDLSSNESDLNVAAGATFSVSDNDAYFDAVTGDGTIQMGYQNDNEFIVGIGNSTSQFDGVIQDTGWNNGTGILNLVKQGTGTFTVTGANTYTGATTVSGGTLQIGAGSTTGSLGTGSVTNNASLVFNRSNVLTVANAITGTGGLTKSGAGTLSLTGTNTYSGTTRISAGTLRAIDTQGLPSASHLLFDGGVFQSSGTFTRSNTPTAGTSTFSNSSNKNTLFSAYGGKLTISVGGDALPEQTIRGSNGSAANQFRLLMFSGADGNAEVEVRNNISLNNRTIVVDVTTGDGSGNFFGTLSGVIRDGDGEDAATIQKQGAGRLNLTGNNTYSGQTRLNNNGATSIIGLGHKNALGMSNLYVGSVGHIEALIDLSGENKILNEVTLDNNLTVVGANSLEIGSDIALAASRTITNSITGGGELTLSGTTSASTEGLKTLNIRGNASTTISGAIQDGSGSIALSKFDAGTLVLSGASTYSGGTNLTAGTLTAGASSTGAVTNGPFGTGTVTVADGAALDLNGQTVANAMTIQGTGVSSSGALFNSASSAATVDGALTLSGDATIKSEGDLVLGSVSGAHALTLQNTGDVIFAEDVGASEARLASLSLSGNLELRASVWTSGAQSYAGDIGVTGDVVLNSSAGGVTVDGDVLSRGNETLLYQTITPTRSSGAVVYVSGYGLGGSDSASAFDASGSSIDRIIYRMQVDVDGTLRYAEVSFDAWEAGLTAYDLRIPDLTSGNAFAVQEFVQNMTIESNMTADASGNSDGIVTGQGLTGYLEIWPYNYGPQATDTGPPGSNNSLFDFNDSHNSSSNYGSFQVHDVTTPGAQQTVLAWNRQFDNNPEVGLGTASVGHPDWTFSGKKSLGKSNWRLDISAGSAANLTLNAGSGTVTLSGDVTGLDEIDILSNAANSTAQGLISGDTVLSKAGSGVLTLSGANTYTGGTTVSAGTLKAGGSSTGAVTNGPFGTGTVTVADGAALDLNGQTVANALTIQGTGVSSSGALFNSASSAATVDGALTLAGNTAIKSTAGGDLTFGSTIDGGHTLTIAAGTSDVKFEAAVGNTTALGSVTIESVATLDTDSVFKAASFTQSAGSVLTQFDGAVTLTGAFDFTGDALTLNAALSATTVEVTNDDTFTTAAAGDITSTGVFTQNGAGANSLAGDIITTNSSISVATGITLAGDLTLSTGSGGGDIALGGTVNGGQALTLAAGTGGIDFDGEVGGSTPLASLSVNSGTLILDQNVETTAAQSYSSIVALGGDVTLVSSGAGVTFADEVVANGYSLSVTAHTAANFSGAVGASVADLAPNGISTIGNSRDSASTTYVYIQDTLAPETVGSSVQTWGLAAASGTAGRSVTPLLFEKVGSSYVLRAIGATRTPTAGTADQTFDFDVQEGSAEIRNSHFYFGWKDGTQTSSNQGVISWDPGSGAMTTVALGGNSSQNITATDIGTALSFDNTSLGDRSYRFSVGTDGGAALNHLTVDAGSMSVTGDVSLSGQLGATVGTTSSISGVISGATASLQKAGSGTLTVSGANTFGGGTTVNGGTLKAGVSSTGSVTNGPFGTGTVTVADGAALDLNGQTIANALTIQGTGVSSSGALFNSASGAATVSGNVTLANNATVGVGSLGDLSIGGVISGAYDLTVSGAGTLTLTGANSYSGETNLSAVDTVLVIADDTPSSNAYSFAGSGQVRIEPVSTSFSAAIDSGDWTFASTLSGLTIGKTGNTADITVSSALTVAGAIQLYGGDIDLDAGLDTRVGASTAAIDLRATGSVTQAAGVVVRTDGANITYGSNVDDLNGGVITLGVAAELLTAGGDVLLSGGSDLTTGYAIGTVSHGLTLNRATIESGAGNVTLRGQGIGDGYGVYLAGNTTQVASDPGATIQTTTGNITIDAVAGSTTGLIMNRGNANITTTDGNIQITSDGTVDIGRLDDNAGNNPIVSSSGSGTIAIVTTTGGFTLNSSIIQVNDGNMTIQSAGGLSQIWGGRYRSLGTGNIVVTASGIASLGNNPNIEGAIYSNGSGDVSVTASEIRLAGAVDAAADVTFNSPVVLTSASGAVAIDASTATFVSTVDGAKTLQVNGNAVFTGAVGATTPLTSLTVSGTSDIDGGQVRTTGAQTYSGAVTLGAHTTLTGTVLSANSTVSLGGYGLVVSASDSATIDAVRPHGQ